MKTKKRLGIPLCRQCNCYHTLGCENVFADAPFDVLCKRINRVCANIGALLVAFIILHTLSLPVQGLLVWSFFPDGEFPGNAIAITLFVSAYVITALLLYCITQRKKWFPKYFGKAHF